MAVFWVVVPRQLAPQIRESNSVRVVGSLYVGGMGLGEIAGGAPSANPSAPSPMAGVFSSFSLLTDGSRPIPTDISKSQQPLGDLQQASKTVETVVYVWERMMYSGAALLLVACVASWLTGRVRIAHLSIAVVMLLVTLTTLAGMRIIEHPSAGAMPALPLVHHALAGVTLSAYAWILLAVFVRREPVQEPIPPAS